MNQLEESQGEMASFNFGFLMESDTPTVERSSTILKLCHKKNKTRGKIIKIFMSFYIIFNTVNRP
jgi:hypothetical protein